MQFLLLLTPLPWKTNTIGSFGFPVPGLPVVKVAAFAAKP
jgi:hypothetical protein